MSKLLMVAALAVAIPSAALACDDHKEAANEVKKVTLAEAAKLQQEKKATLVDANGKQTRAKYGTIPGAVLLTSYNKYDLKELPASKSEKLVFFCANTQCQASHAAAERALEAGYTDVNVLPDGIMGWKQAGKPVATPQS
jgi:rhodanese-related sulfurtransferase